MTETTNIAPNKGKNLEIKVGEEIYLRLPIRTGLVSEKDLLDNLIEKYAAPHLVSGDFIFVSEKVLALTQNRILPINEVEVGPLARFLARRVRTGYGTENFRGFGHSTPPAMQLFINEAGYLRTLFAAAVSAVTRPLGIKGAFYYICGKRAKSVDCPMSFIIQPYTHYAKLPPLDPKGVTRHIKERFGYETAIVDANYLGAFSMGESSGAIKEKFIQEVLRDNPLGQADEMTPICIVRKKIFIV